MKFGVTVPNFGAFFDPRTLAETAHEAEVAGWDGFFRAKVESYRDAGATWWLEDVSPWRFGWNWRGEWPYTAMRDRIRGGPPTL